MISSKGREIKKSRVSRMSKKMQRLFREGKCRECSVVVTRMNFAKIFGKFSKVKIKYETDSPATTKKSPITSSPNARLKNNENGMVLLHRNVYKPHPVKEAISSKKPKINQIKKPTENVLKENNRLRRPLELQESPAFNGSKKTKHTTIKKYEIIFVDPDVKNNNDVTDKVFLQDLLPAINRKILPSPDWCIEYFPKTDEPKDDKVYDRIAAELEDLMNTEKKVVSEPCKKPEVTENNNEEFPSIMDILNENNVPKVKTDPDTNDVEAILLGKSNKESQVAHVEINSDMKKLLEDVEQLDNIPEAKSSQEKVVDESHIDIPQHSPSILDETLQKGIEEHLPAENLPNNDTSNNASKELSKEEENNVNEDIHNKITAVKTENTEAPTDIMQAPMDITQAPMDIMQAPMDIMQAPMDMMEAPRDINVTHIVFKKLQNGKCLKSITCAQDLKFNVEFGDKSVEFLGAPKHVSSLEDLQVLLQIVNESDLESLYVLC